MRGLDPAENQKEQRPQRAVSENTDFQRLLLIARDDDASFRGRPLGARDTVASLLTGLLPRLTFATSGTGTAKRGEAELTVQLVGDPVSAIELTLRPEHLNAFRPPLERVAARAGWQLLDADRGEVLFPVQRAVASTAPSGAAQVLRWSLAALLMVASVAGGAWWTFVGSTDYMIVPAPGRMPGSAASAVPRSAGATGGVPELTGFPEGIPGSVEEFAAQAQRIGELVARRRALAPQFRSMRVVNELMMINAAEVQFQALFGNGRYVDPAMLAGHSKGPPGLEVPTLPAEFATPSRGGYRFSFSGSGEGTTFSDAYKPAYAEFVYLASPEPGETSQYAFALRSETGKIHYTTDGRIPTETDPSVTDRVATDAPEVIKEVGHRFLRSKPMQDAQLAYHEDRAIKDLRVFAAAQQAFFSMLSGYGSPEALSEPSILTNHPAIRPFLERSFTQEVREGYQFSFIGQAPARGTGTAALYNDFTYLATPVGNGPASRRSFAVYADGVIRFRTDGAAPQKSDSILGS